MINITINGKTIEVEENTTILDAARSVDIDIPTLCHLDLHNVKNVNNSASCRICVVEVEGRNNLLPACSVQVAKDMVIHTDSEKVNTARKTVLDLLLSNHHFDCENCHRNHTCELQSLAKEFDIKEITYKGERKEHQKDTSSLSFVRDPNKCILCGRCETICNNFQTVGVYSKIDRGFDTTVSTAFEKPVMDSVCTFCGGCVSVCPTSALTEVDNTGDVLKALNSDKYVIVQTAPSVRVALGEPFGCDPGTDVTGKMVTALRNLGFKKVFDTNFAADLTVMEETMEFMMRLKNNGPLPILTSCCPAWVRFFEYQYPELLEIPSTCKSPQAMFGSMAKSYLAKKLNIKPENMIVVSIMPCLAKKYEKSRDELSNNGIKDVDFVLSTRELAKLIKSKNINFNNLKDDTFDSPLGESTGSADIFGITGGVAEAVVRNASYLLTDNKKDIDFKELRGMDGIKEKSVTINDIEVKIAIAHGLSNARVLLDNIKEGKSDYHIIEIMACNSGCIGGGGQPYFLKNNQEILNKRANGLYNIDKEKEIRISCLNPDIQTLYDEFLGDAGGHKAHELLHTSYKKKEEN